MNHRHFFVAASLRIACPVLAASLLVGQAHAAFDNRIASNVQRGRYLRISQIQRLQNAGRLDSSLRWIQQPAEAVVA